MSFLSKMNKVKSVAAVTHRPGGLVRGYLVDKAERYGTSYGVGFINGYYREQAQYRGLPITALAGLGLVLGAGALEVMSGGRSKLAPHMNAIGDAAVGHLFAALGTSLGARKSGRQVFVLNKGAAIPKALPPGMVALGMIPQAVAGAGAYLSPDQIARFSAAR